MKEEISRDLDVRRSSVTLWFGGIAGPLAFLIAQLVKYASVQFICRNHMTWILWATAAAALVLAIVAGLASARYWPSDDSRVHFMAICGVVISALSALSIIALTIPDFFFHPCD